MAWEGVTVVLTGVSFLKRVSFRVRSLLNKTQLGVACTGESVRWRAGGSFQTVYNTHIEKQRIARMLSIRTSHAR